MKRKLFYISFCLISIYLLEAQSLRVGRPSHKSLGNVKTYDLAAAQAQDRFFEEQIPKSLLGINPLPSKNATNTRGKVAKNANQQAVFIQRAASALAPSFTESFETYNGVDLNWIPTNWTEQNKTGNTFVNDGTPNPTWHITEGGDQRPSVGKYMAWVNYAEGKNQDEWLISNPFTLGKGEEYIYFDANYSSFYMYIDYNAFLQTGQISFDFTKPTATLQAYVSTDNGQNWEMIWDAHEEAGMYNNSNINDYKVAKWHSIKKSLIKYSGKSIKIAFRYVGKDGDAMGLDNIEIRALSPDTYYQRPKGYFYLGYTQNFTRTAVDFTYGAPYEEATWINKSGEEADAFNWTFPDPDIDNKTFTTSAKNPKVTYPNGIFKMPLLRASAGLNDSTYIWGTAQNGSYFLLGGQPNFGWGTIGVGNYDRTKGIAAYRFKNDDYVFGTDSTNRLFSVVNYFEKPQKKYVLDNIWINFGRFEAPPETEFKIIIHKFKTNAMGQIIFGDTIAWCSALAQDVTNPVTGFYSLNFHGFTNFDPKSGLDATKEYLEIEDAILIEFTGFANNPAIKLGVFSQRLNSSGNENNAYVILNYNGSRVVLSSNQYISSSTSLLINLGLTYSYLQVENNLVLLSAQSNTKKVVINSNYQPDDWWLIEALPDWLTAKYNYDTKSMVSSIDFTAKTLPDGLDMREAIVKIATYGSDLVLNVKQDRFTGIQETDLSAATRVLSFENTFDLIYSSEFQNVAILNTAGQIIGNYNLPSIGNLTLSSSGLAKGMYIFKFSGKANKSIKIIR